MRSFRIICATAAFLLPPTARPAVELAVEPSQSYIVVRVEKGGLLAFAGGHRHGVLATNWNAALCWEEANPAASSVRVSVQTGAVVIDTPQARERAGLAERGPGPKDVQELQAKLLTARFLSAAEHPEIRFLTTAVRAQRADELLLTGPLTIRGQSRSVSAPVKIERRDDGALALSGVLRVRQTDFGIKPESVGGVVNVRDEVEIRLRFFARRTGRACQ